MPENKSTTIYKKLDYSDNANCLSRQTQFPMIHYRNMINIALVLIATICSFAPTSFAIEANEVSSAGFLSSERAEEQVSVVVSVASEYHSPPILLDVGREETFGKNCVYLIDDCGLVHTC